MMYVNVFVDSDLLIIIVIDLHIRCCSLINFRLFIKHNIYRVSKWKKELYKCCVLLPFSVNYERKKLCVCDWRLEQSCNLIELNDDCDTNV